jgi:hypothetical protein
MRDHSDDEWMARNVILDILILTNYTCLSPHFDPFLLKTFILILLSLIGRYLTYAVLEKPSLLGIFISDGNSIDSF